MCTQFANTRNLTPIHKHTLKNTNIRKYINKNSLTHTHTHTHTQTHTHTRARARAHTQRNKQTNTHTQIHAPTVTQTHYTHALPQNNHKQKRVRPLFIQKNNVQDSNGMPANIADVDTNTCKYIHKGS